jgi:succinyl-CoA synthetase beta subunit
LEVRHVKIHEYQGKAVLSQYGVPVPRGKVAYTVEEAAEVAKGLGFPVVVKAQIHAGGRGKGGGVKVAKTLEDCEALAKSMLGMTLRTHQTGPEGRVVRRLLIEEGMDLAGAKEMYLAALVDRAESRPVVMASAQGGMDIEEVAARDPDAILKEHVDPAVGFQPYQARKLAFGLGLPGALVGQAVSFMTSLYRAFEGVDASLVEINPLLVTKAGELVALDAKVNFDDNALFRHPELVELRDFDEEEPLEVDASKHDLNYIKLEGGNVGCMVNGAGLAMATMDIIKLAGGNPANFLDVGGGANADQIRNAFRILLADPDVKAVLINIFGGILRCDVLAEGVIAAVRDLDVKVPVVVRMKGNKEPEGRKMLEESGLNFETAEDMTGAAEKVVQAAGGGGR